MGFIDISIVDIIDILLVAMILYQIYRWTKGTNALRIIMGIVMVYVLWLLVRLLNMELLSMILGQVIGVGVIALIIVFQQEIRRFLLMLGTRYSQSRKTFVGRLFKPRSNSEIGLEWVDSVVDACADMSLTNTGALIVIARSVDLTPILETGERIDASISTALIKNIFFKNAPLHDGALVIVNERIKAAKCILPSTEREVPIDFGMRHRAALGLSEITDALIVVVSEETGNVSAARKGQLRRDLTVPQLRSYLRKALTMS